MQLEHLNSQAGVKRPAPPTALNGGLVLASASSRRAELLESMGLSFEILPSGVDESVLPGESAETHCRRLAVEKAKAVALQRPDAWVLGADTIVVAGRRILGKPRSAADARAMLTRLSGRTHRVFTGFALRRQDRGFSHAEVVKSSVRFREIAVDEMEGYILTGEPFDKAGAYAVQGRGASFIREIRGSYTAVVGLPLAEVATALRRAGVFAYATEG